MYYNLNGIANIESSTQQRDVVEAHHRPGLSQAAYAAADTISEVACHTARPDTFAWQGCSPHTGSGHL